MTPWATRWAQLTSKLLPKTDTFRWIDEPNQTVDVFGTVAVLSLYRNVSSAEERELGRRVLDSSPLKTVYLKRRPREAHRSATASAAEVAPPRPLFGEPCESVESSEGGMRVEIRPANGLSVGLYLDARDARAWVRAHAADKTVLNLFSYTCGFGVSALLGGARRAVNLDLSRKVLDWGMHNLELNALPTERRDFIAGDCFEWLDRFAKKAEQFDLVVIDPPSFSNADGRRFRAETDYAQLVEAAQRVVAPGGSMLCCCNLETIGAQRLAHLVKTGLGGRPAKERAAFGASQIDFAQPSALKVLAYALD